MGWLEQVQENHGDMDYNDAIGYRPISEGIQVELD